MSPLTLSVERETEYRALCSDNPDYIMGQELLAEIDALRSQPKPQVDICPTCYAPRVGTTLRCPEIGATLWVGAATNAPDPRAATQRDHERAACEAVIFEAEAVALQCGPSPTVVAFVETLLTAMNRLYPRVNILASIMKEGKP